jgi:hypothetical protein
VHGGDTAIVAIQYSFLPSRLAIFMDAGLADEAGMTLLNAVRARWSKLPPQHRPKLVLFGKSLGAAGVEAPFVGADAAASVANMMAGTDGVLIAGAKQSNPIHAQLTHARDRGSPFWQPVFDGGRSVRFLSRDPHQPRLDADWPAPRIVYLQHPADPAVFWSPAAFWRPPEWLAPASRLRHARRHALVSDRLGRAGRGRSDQSALCAAGVRTQLLVGRLHQGLGQRGAARQLDGRRYGTARPVPRQGPRRRNGAVTGIKDAQASARSTTISLAAPIVVLIARLRTHRRSNQDVKFTGV